MQKPTDPSLPRTEKSTIPFNRPTVTGGEAELVAAALQRAKIGPGGPNSLECQKWLSGMFETERALPTGSCTAALEIAMLLLDLAPGDEVVMPSFGYPSTANAVVRAGGVPVFCDIEPETLNIDPDAVDAAVTSRTRAIVPIHYGGCPADLDRLVDIATSREAAVIEDAANAFGSTYRGRQCGTFGSLACLSFHETKLVHCGQGGALLVNDREFVDRAEVILEKGTDRRQFLRGEVDKYTWRDVGSSFAIDDIRAAFLLAQLRTSGDIVARRKAIWAEYAEGLRDLADEGRLRILRCPSDRVTNGMIFWALLEDEQKRDSVLEGLARRGVHATFHYVPLHSSEAGRRFGRFFGEDRYTSDLAARLIRLPIYAELDRTDIVVDAICAAI